VGQKLSNYQDLRTDDILKDYLIAGQDEFIQMCKRVVEGSNLSVHEVSPINGGCQIMAGESSTKWRNQRSQPRLIHFLRITDPVDESTIRDFNELIREHGVPRGLIFTSSTFTRLAQVFAENRPIELHDKEPLQKLLKRYAQD
jgi:hypothetical protein